VDPLKLDLFVALVQAAAVHKNLAVPAAEVVKALVEQVKTGVQAVLDPHVDATEVLEIIQAVCAVFEAFCPIVDSMPT
jgi:hypothetical protein